MFQSYGQNSTPNCATNSNKTWHNRLHSQDLQTKIHQVVEGQNLAKYVKYKILTFLLHIFSLIFQCHAQ